MDEKLFFWAWVEVDAHLLHSSELLENISVHGYVSAKSNEQKSHLSLTYVLILHLMRK